MEIEYEQTYLPHCIKNWRIRGLRRSRRSVKPRLQNPRLRLRWIPWCGPIYVQICQKWYFPHFPLSPLQCRKSSSTSREESCAHIQDPTVDEERKENIKTFNYWKLKIGLQSSHWGLLCGSGKGYFPVRYQAFTRKNSDWLSIAKGPVYKHVLPLIPL